MRCRADVWPGSDKPLIGGKLNQGNGLGEKSGINLAAQQANATGLSLLGSLARPVMTQSVRMLAHGELSIESVA